MGEYLNPGNAGFATIRNGVYVDKTGLIDYINGTIDTPFKLTCFSRPRRFGKSFAAKMLCAYYDKGCDSRSFVPEFPTGKGFADLSFLPRRKSDKPAMIVELKYDKNADTAIRQIHENRYDGDLKKYFGNLLLVGINYDSKAGESNVKRHTCVIERV